MMPRTVSAVNERRIATVGLVAELESRDHPSYVEDVFTESLHTLALYHTPHSEPTVARFHGSGTQMAFRELGRIVTMPANIPMEVKGKGGRICAIRCCFAPELLTRISGRDHFGTRSELDACADVRSRAVRTMLEALGRELENPGFASGAYVEAIGHGLVVELARYLHETPAPARATSGLSKHQMTMVTDYIHASHQAPTLMQVADLLGFSSRHVNRIFRRSTGKTLHRYIEDVRFDRACAMLSQGDLLVKEVAFELGFSCSSNFAAAFRRRAGMAPQHYSRLYRKGRS